MNSHFNRSFDRTKRHVRSDLDVNSLKDCFRGHGKQDCRTRALSQKAEANVPCCFAESFLSPRGGVYLCSSPH